MTRLQELAPDLWETTSALRVGGVVFPLRMTVVRSDGELILWSPVSIDDVLAEELRALGEVRFIVGPNKMHHVFLEQAAAHWPRADLLGAPGLLEKRQDLSLASVLDAELGPELFLANVRGVPGLDEVVLHHRPSRTLVVTDLVFHILEAETWMSRLMFQGFSGAFGKLAQSRLLRFMTKDKEAYRRSIDGLLDLDFNRLVMAHGEVIEGSARTRLEEALVGRRAAPTLAPERS